MKIMPGPELIAHTIDLPAFDFGFEILAEHLQPADQLIAGIDIGDLQHPFAERDARHQFLGGIGPDLIGALLRQRPEFAGVVEADACDQVADRQAVTRHHRAELVAGCAPADVPALQNGDAGAEARGLQRHREPGKPRADHADVDIQIEGKAQPLRHAAASCRLVAPAEVSLMLFSYGPAGRLSPCTITDVRRLCIQRTPRNHDSGVDFASEVHLTEQQRR